MRECAHLQQHVTNQENMRILLSFFVVVVEGKELVRVQTSIYYYS